VIDANTLPDLLAAIGGLGGLALVIGVGFSVELSGYFIYGLFLY